MTEHRPAPRRAADGPIRLGDSLQRLAGYLGPRGAALRLGDHWDAAVGAHISAAAQPVALEHGCLVVEAADVAWATELRYMEAQILEALASTLRQPAITSIRIRVAQPDRPFGRSPSRRTGRISPPG